MLTEALFSTIAEAFFSVLFKEMPLADRVRAGVDPEREAFQEALEKAYTTFSDRYPDWKASLFDEHFLRGAAAPVLAQLLTRRGQPDPADLACKWVQHLGHQDPQAWPRLSDATRAAADFLDRLEAELKTQPPLQALWDSRAL
ncbi:hypothetical protein, partial [uncultured Chloroflexus sp.]|uniref:hypothetical protein n=1 Tax=uncultured Chloroflexus sp. TaxID=214040 RepID=UPI002615DB6A